MRIHFISAIKRYQKAFGTDLSSNSIERLANYYELVMERNHLLHLVGPCSPDEFATRHILESLTLLEFLPENARIADIGTGAGLPSIPCLIVREDLQGVLIESKAKKAGFLSETSEHLGLGQRVSIVNKQFKETSAANISHVTCRALDRFTENLPAILKWSNRKRLLFFGGKDLGKRLQESKIRFVQKLLPLSEQRFLYVSNK